MKIIRYGEKPTTNDYIFLAGPSHQNPSKSWRPLCATMIEGQGYKGEVIFPEWHIDSGTHEENKAKNGWTGNDVVEWEDTYLEGASVILFWMPFVLLDKDDPNSLPGFTTRLELGLWIKDFKIVVGMPNDVNVGTSAIRYYCRKYHNHIYPTLIETVQAAMMEIKQRDELYIQVVQD